MTSENERPEVLALRTISSRQIDSFWSKLDRDGDCWLWRGGKDKGGYGKFQVTNHLGGPKQYHVRAHRMAFALTHGRAPELYVLHACDTPLCCNPAHLSEGTQKQNIADMDRRGRRGRCPDSSRLRGDAHPSRTHPERLARGERHGMAKLTAESVALIRDALANKEKQRDIAKRFGVSQTAVWSIGNGRAWGHIA